MLTYQLQHKFQYIELNKKEVPNYSDYTLPQSDKTQQSKYPGTNPTQELPSSTPEENDFDKNWH